MKLMIKCSQLTSPVITLYVGDAKTQYHAHEVTICQLQFFRAALQGQFKEASEKIINMPEDDPAAIAALIEWLSTGNYTYNGNKLQKTTMELRAAPEVPSEGLLEGLFHLEVCVVASKYDCATLLVAAKHGFYLSQGKLAGIDILRLWKAQDSSGLEGFKLLYMDNSVSHLQDVRTLVIELFGQHREELSNTVKQFPDLILNMLEKCAEAPQANEGYFI